MYDNYHLSPNSMLPLANIEKAEAISQNKGKICEHDKTKTGQSILIEKFVIQLDGFSRVENGIPI